MKKEILARQKNVFMYVLAAIIIMLFVVNGVYYSSKYTELQQYHDRANARRTPEHPFFRFYYAPPSPLMFCCDNDEKQQTITFSPGLNSLRIWQNNNEKGNIFLATGYSVDWTYIVQFICSLLMIVLSYNVFSGELERKTLSLIGSYSISRWKIYICKFCSVFFISMIILAAAMLTGLITILILGSIPITTAVITDVSLFYMFSLLYCSLFIFIGMSASITMRNSTISLIVSVFLWIFILLIIPKGAGIIAARLTNSQSDYERTKKYDHLRKDYDAEIQEIFKEAWKLAEQPDLDKDSFIEDIKQQISTADNKKADLEYRYGIEILQDNLNRYHREQRWKNMSPAVLFRDIIGNMFQCGNVYFLNYIEQLRNFTSRFREDMYNRYKTYVDYYNIGGGVVTIEGEQIMIRPDVPTFEYNGMEFEYKDAGFFESLRAAMQRLVVLIVLTMTIGIWGFIGFVRCDIR